LICQSERAARKATILQMATMYSVLGGTLLNLGITLSSQGNQTFANGSFLGAGEIYNKTSFKYCLDKFSLSAYWREK